MEAREFANFMAHFSYAEPRFDSRTLPLFRFFKLMPVALEVAQQFASGDGKEAVVCKGFLMAFQGHAGYDAIVSAAATIDVLVVMHPILRVHDQTCEDASVEARFAAEVRDTLRSLLRDGALWLQQSSGTLTHSVLKALSTVNIIAPPLRGYK